MEIEPARLRERLRYDAETGLLFWRPQEPRHFNATAGRSAEHTCANWNSLFADKEAFTNISGQGYRRGRVFGQGFLAHRVIWAIVMGAWPDEIDHQNGVRTDNRLCNLRNVQTKENAKNKAVRSDSVSGVSGVHEIHSSGRWRAKIKRNGAQLHLGCFDTLAEAEAARKSAAARLGYHPNHGRKPILAKHGANNG